MSAKPPLSLITGASAGIGAAFATALAARGHELILTARRTARLETLAEQLRQQYGRRVWVWPADLADPMTPQRLHNQLIAHDLSVDGLINNAGYGLPGQFTEVDWSQHASFLQVMVTAPSELCWRLLPAMQARASGTIINVASLAAFAPGTAGHTQYSAAKAFMLKFTESLALEQQRHGIKVCALCPGFTYSEFHDVTGTRALMQKLPTILWQSAEAVVIEALQAIDAGRPVHVSGRVNRLLKTALKLAPETLSRQLAARQARHYRAPPRT